MDTKFDTQEFRQMLAEALQNAVSDRCLQGYDSTVIDELQKIAVEVSSKKLIEDGATLALQNATTVAQTAAAIAQGANKCYIQWEDVEYAIELKYCNVYPFCIEK